MGRAAATDGTRCCRLSTERVETEEAELVATLQKAEMQRTELEIEVNKTKKREARRGVRARHQGEGGVD